MIIIPMAGLSSRFTKAGYKKPKYMLEAHNKTIFSHAINSFNAFFETNHFIFIVRNIDSIISFVNHEAQQLGIKSFKVVTLDHNTRGQAETVYIALEREEQAYNGPITIFNIDTFRINFTFPKLNDIDAGYLEVFKGSGDNWSFVKPVNNNSTLINETAEKKAISNLCCTGLYYFSKKNDFINAYNNYLSIPSEEWEKGELYIAPLYNYLIKQNKKIHYHLIERSDVIFCGIPSEYEEFLNESF